MSEQGGAPQNELEQAYDLLDQGDLQSLHALLEDWRKRGIEEPHAGLLGCQMFLVGGRFAEARQQLELARASLERGDPELLFVEGEWALASWRIEEAHAAFERLTRIEPDPSSWIRLALCEDLLDRPEAAERAMARVERHVPPEDAEPTHHPPETFEAIVERAAERLPPQFREVLEHTPVVIDPVPRRELARGHEAETPPDLLGLFVGASALEGSIEGTGESPAVIYLFQRNIERECVGRAQLEEQIVITLYHELAHRLGFDEDGVDAMGLG